MYGELELYGLAGVWLQVADGQKGTVYIASVSDFANTANWNPKFVFQKHSQPVKRTPFQSWKPLVQQK